MQIPLILSKMPIENQLSQVFKDFGFEACVFVRENDWSSVKNNSSEVVIDFFKVIDKKWQHNLLISIHKKVENPKIFYLKLAKHIAQMTDCDVICCCYDNNITNDPIEMNPFYDFAYINQHWYWIDDIDADYANDRLEGGEIKIIKSIDKEMEYFLEFGNYLHHNH